jgi:DNA replication protein DnaC
MKSLKTELQKIQASPAHSEPQFNYREILTDQEIDQQLDYHMTREKKNRAFRMAESGLNPNTIAHRMSEIKWEFSDEAKDKILTEAAKRKIWYLEDLQSREKNRLMMEEKKLAIKATWTHDEFMRLIRTHYIAKHGKFIERVDQAKYFKALCYFLSEDVRFETELNYSFKKGFFITGESGVGKTETLKALKNNPVRSMAIISMIDVTNLIKSTGDCNIPENKLVVLDDVGVEPIPIKHYGTDVRWFADFIESRYIAQQNFSNLVITTNLGGDDIQNCYGYRIRSRVREMFNVISVEGEDIRK